MIILVAIYGLIMFTLTYKLVDTVEENVAMIIKCEREADSLKIENTKLWLKLESLDKQISNLNKEP